MKKVVLLLFNILQYFAHPSVKLLSEDLRYQRYLVPAFLLFCLLDALIFGIFSSLYLHSDPLSLFSYASALSFIALLMLSRRSISTRPLIVSYIVLISSFFVAAVVVFDQADLLIVLGRFSVYVIVAVLLAGRRVVQAFTGFFVFIAASVVVGRRFDTFVVPEGMTHQTFVDAFLVSSILSCVLLFIMMVIYNKACDFALSHMEKQKEWHDSNRLTKEFVNLAGDMNSVMQGPLEDVMNALRSLRHPHGDGVQGLATIKRASEAVYGIARSFGVLAQDQKETYMVRINLDELVRYAQIVCQNHFQGLGVSMQYEAAEGSVEFTGASGRWLLLLVSMMQFMAEQIHRTGGRRLHLKRQNRDNKWELVLLADGAAPFEFPFDLRQKLKEESTQELLHQTSGKAFLYLLDQWGLKLGSTQTA